MVINQICTLLGLTQDQLPSTINLSNWIEGIRKHYGGYAPEELFLACELNHYGKLSTKTEHYGKFSIDYLSNCLKNYEEKKQAEILREKSKPTPPPTPSKAPQLGFHEGRAYYIEIEKWVKNTGELPLFWDWGKCYKFLLDNGDLVQDFPKSRMLEIYDRFKSLGRAEATTGRFSANTIGKSIAFDELSADKTVQHECRKYVVQQYLVKKFDIQKKV